MTHYLRHPRSRTHRGYTLIELLITVTITTIIITIGVSAYGRSSEIQATKADTEKILATLTAAQKAATSGKEDCSASSGPYLGERLTTSGNTMTLRSSCTSGFGATRTISLTTYSFSTSNTLTFRPLNQGIDTGASASQNIDYTKNGVTYRIQVERGGTIKSLGRVTP